MEKEKELNEISKILDKTGLFEALKVDNVNHRPHVYMITPKHLSKNDSMYLGEEQLNRMEEKHGPMCGMKNCNIYYKNHKSDKVVFLLLTKNLTNKQAGKELVKIKPFMEQNGFQGLALIDTPEKFRIKSTKK